MALETSDLSERTAFITGTTRGIGKAIVLSLVDAGCNIVSTGKTAPSSSAPSEEATTADADSDVVSSPHRLAGATACSVVSIAASPAGPTHPTRTASHPSIAANSSMMSFTS
jgi:NAD(P)-dependent dehydrogenase (short-subunit alcohol dehydrogenase family)